MERKSQKLGREKFPNTLLASLRLERLFNCRFTARFILCREVMPASRRARGFNSNLLLGMKRAGMHLHLDLDVDTGREVQARERLDRLGVGVEDIDNAFMDAHLELFARVLVNEG